MYRGQYDTDVSVWSPQGRLLQVEYAMEAVKQGSISLGLTNKRHAVLAALKRSPGPLAGYQKKIYPIDDHCGMAISGLNSDARIVRYLWTLNVAIFYRDWQHRSGTHTIDPSRWPSSARHSQTVCPDFKCRIAESHADLWGASKRSWTTGGGCRCMLNGVSLWECMPAGTAEPYHAIAIGARSQPARTYLENHLDAFRASLDLEELCIHAIKALSASMPTETPLAPALVSMAVVGIDEPFRVLSDTEIAEYFSKAQTEPAAMDI